MERRQSSSLASTSGSQGLFAEVVLLALDIEEPLLWRFLWVSCMQLLMRTLVITLKVAAVSADLLIPSLPLTYLC